MDSLPISAELNDGQSAPNGATQLAEPSPTETGLIQARPARALPDFGKLMKKHRTFAAAVKAYLEPYYDHIPAIAQGPTPEAEKARFDRVFRPWPKWVLRISAELWHVDYPTIPSEIFFQTFRLVNAFFFRCPTNPETQKLSDASLAACDRVDVKVLSVIIAAFFGHAYEHAKACRKQLDEDLSAGKITPGKYAQAIKGLSPEFVENPLREMFDQWSKDNSVSPFELTQTLEDARRKTFDKHGRPKESPLTPVHRKMLYNWIVVENMSGPKELANFLNPDLKGELKDAERYYSRIAAMCSRLKVRFRGKSRRLELQRRHPSP